MELIPEYLQSLVLIIACTALVKIATVLSIVRYGLGLYDFVFGGVVLAVSLILALIVAEPLVNNMPANTSISNQLVHFEPFLKKNSDPEVFKQLDTVLNKDFQTEGIGEQSPEHSAEAIKQPVSENSLLLVSFLISELREAFKVGLLLLIPFVVIDILVMNILMLLGVTQISVAVIALPIKLLLFIGVDGWNLITQKLLGAYL